MTDFPFLLAGTYDGTGGEPDLRHRLYGGEITSTSGYDIKFTSDASGDTTLSYEIEIYEASTGKVSFWIKIPTLDCDDNTTIYMWYGNSDITTSQENITGVWDSNYKFVAHCNDDPTSTIYDSTSSPANMTTHGSMGSGNLVDGKFGKAIDFEKDSSQWAGSATSVSKFDITGNYTLQAWLWVESITTNVALWRGDGATYGQYMMETLDSSGSVLMRMRSSGGGSFTASHTFATGGWHFVTMVRSSTTGYIYLDNYAADTGTGFNDPSSSTWELFWGYNDYAPNLFYPDGKVEEMRLSNIARSADWIATEYNNQNDPSTFYTMGSAVCDVSPSLSKSPSPSASASATGSLSVSASPSLSISLSPSISVSRSPSVSVSASPSVSVSVSPSVSISVSPSVSVSLSPSISASVSVSLSPSLSPSVSPSASQSLSQSLTPSVSVSLSPSVSESLSPSSSVSPSASPSATASLSPSVSVSLSPSLSASLTPSLSVSLSPSLSPSGSVSLTTSASPSLTPSVSTSRSPSSSMSRSPSPASTGLVFKVALPGYDASIDKNPDHFALYVDQSADYILIKEKTYGTTSVNGTTNVAHGLSYVPFCLVFCETTSGSWRKLFGYPISASGYWFEVNGTNLVLKNTTGTAKTFAYHIFYDNVT